jgi:hypothetical protein
VATVLRQTGSRDAAAQALGISADQLSDQD